MLLSLTTLLSATVINTSTFWRPVTIDFQLSPFLSLYFCARTGVSDYLPKSLLEAGAAISSDGRGLLSGAMVDSMAVSADSPKSFKVECAALPELIQIGGKDVLVKEPALKLADALSELSQAQIEEFTKNSTTKLDGTRSLLEATFNRFPELLLNAMAGLGLVDDSIKIPVVLVPDAPVPGAITYRTKGAGTLCVVSAAKTSGSDLVETVLHEAIHALDVRQLGKPSHLSSLRSALEKAGTAKSREAAEALHAIIFAQASYSVQKEVDTKHQPYGAKSGAYARMGSAGSNAIRAWNTFLEGKFSLDEALKSIVEGTRKVESSSLSLQSTF